MVEGDLLRDGGQVFFAELCDVKFVAKSAGQGDDPAGLKAGAASDDVVGNYGNVGAHGGQRVQEGGTFLDHQALDGVSVVGAPDLGAVIEHAGIKARAAAGAVFEEQIGEIVDQTALHLIEAQHIAVAEFILIFRSQAGAAEIGESAVHVPFDIFYVGAAQDSGDHIIDGVADFFAREVEDILIAELCRRAAGDLDGPVGMSPVEVGIGRDHFGLKPDAEFHTEGVDFVDQLFQAALDLVFIDKPVSETGDIQVAFAEPAVVHDQHFDTCLLGGAGNVQKLVAVKIKIGRLPVIDEDGTFFVSPDPADQVVPIEVMEGVGHAAQPLAGIDHDSLGCLEGFSGLQCEGETVRVDAQSHADRIVGITFDLAAEVAGIDQVESIDLALVLSR